MRLRSTAEQKVKVRELDLVVPFGAGEEMRTEVSAKFRPEGVRAELAAAGFARPRRLDRRGRPLPGHAGRGGLTRPAFRRKSPSGTMTPWHPCRTG